MRWEITLSYVRVRCGGLLLVDTENFNPVFAECAEILRPTITRVIRNVGIMKKYQRPRQER